MDHEYSNEPMLDIFIYETTQNIEQLENTILASEKTGVFTPEAINEIFRVMHTIKGSSAMMMYHNMASLAHSMEDMFYFIREEKPEQIDCAKLSDFVLEGVDFIKIDLEKIKNSDEPDSDPSELIQRLGEYLAVIKGGGEAASPEPGDTQYYLSSVMGGGASNAQGYTALLFFEDGCEMENIRAYAVLHRLKDIAEDISFWPEDIVDNNESIHEIREHGFRIAFKSNAGREELQDFFENTAFLTNLMLREQDEEDEALFTQSPPPAAPAASAEAVAAAEDAPAQDGSVQAEPVQAAPVSLPKLPNREQLEHLQAEHKNSHQSIISVDVYKLDKLMDLMGEMVIAEAMVTQNPELKALELNSFYKAARQLRKITSEMQDMVMSIRMVPLSATFHKMRRIIRDMARKLGKEVELTLIGEDTEVDKNIIEHISDPLMHLVRNAVDHGIEMPDQREAAGKPRTGQIVLEAVNAGSDVLVFVRDDGAGLNKQKILEKARHNGMLHKPENELTDREIYNMIFLPGFSTNEKVTEFSGRGVGMDVVTKNLEAVGGTVSVGSAEGTGTVNTLKIPLTLAIIDGMNIRVGDSTYTIPTTSIKETFRALEKDIVTDPENNEMIMVRGYCYPILRLHQLYDVEPDVTDLKRGIMLMVENDGKSICLFADELLGQHQVVVKALPAYIKRTRRINGLAGCTLLGDGSISLILNIGELMNM